MSQLAGQEPPNGTSGEEEKASPARMYDYLLGGSTNEEIDRKAVDELLDGLPEIRDGAEANRGFLRRSVRYLAELGVTQFIDLGSGLPTENNTDEVAQRVNPRARVVLVDTDPLVLNHVARLERDTVRAVQADIRHPEEVLNAPAMREVIDFTQPVGLLAVAVCHFIADPYDPYEIMRTYVDELASGSYLALSHLNGDGQPPQSVNRLKKAWEGTPTGIHFRTREQIRGFFDGLELLPSYPSAGSALVPVGQWGAEDPEAADTDGSRWAYCAVGRKP
jgi:S-adenosyl methyltransferase